MNIYTITIWQDDKKYGVCFSHDTSFDCSNNKKDTPHFNTLSELHKYIKDVLSEEIIPVINDCLGSPEE